MNVADDNVAMAAIRQPRLDMAEALQNMEPQGRSRLLADRADDVVHVLSRWAGILAFVGTVAFIGWLVL